MDDCLSDDDWSDSDWEGDLTEAIHALSDSSPSSRLVTVAARFLIFATGLAIVPINSLVGRLPRGAWKFLRYSDLYQDITKTWPTFYPEVQDQFNLANFRVDQNTFEGILLEVQVISSACMKCFHSCWSRHAALLICHGFFTHVRLQDDITLNPLRRTDTTPAKKRLAITMFFLAQGDHYHSVATALDIHKSSVSKHLHDVMPVLERKLFACNISFPANSELLQVVADFADLIGMPQSAGATDGCFTSMETSTGIFSDKYWCYKNIHAIILLAIVDARGIFTAVNIGQPASVGDGAAFNRSKIKARLESGAWLPRTFSRRFRNAFGRGRVMVRPFIVADAAFSLCAYMMKAYNNPPMHCPQHGYNYCHIRTRRVVENAFGRLKGRFRVLKQGKLNDPRWVMQITKVCCALHNMCERCNSPYEKSWFPHNEKYALHNLNRHTDQQLHYKYYPRSCQYLV